MLVGPHRQQQLRSFCRPVHRPATTPATVSSRCATTSRPWPPGPRRQARARSWCSTRRPARSWRMWSNPSYDPNPIATTTRRTGGRAPARRCSTPPGEPLLANGYQERYMPGSTFKVITARPALETRQVTPTTPFPDGHRVQLPPQTTDADPELRRRGVRRHAARRSSPQSATPRSPRWAPDPRRRRRWCDGAEQLRLQRRRRRSTCPARRQSSSGVGDDFADNLPLLDPDLASRRSGRTTAGHAAADGDGRLTSPTVA